MRLKGLLHHVVVVAVSDVQLVLLVWRSRVKWGYWIGMLHMGMLHGVHFFAGHIGSAGHSCLFRCLRMSAAHSGTTARRVIWDAVGWMMVRHIALMLWIVLHLAIMRGWMVHMLWVAVRHMRVAIVVWCCTIMSMRIIVMTWHNMIWIRALTVIMLPVRTVVVHIAAIFGVWFSFGGWSVMSAI